jgi:hypothetical protein
LASIFGLIFLVAFGVMSAMAGGRDVNKMKQIAAFITKDFKLRLEREAKRRGTTVADMIRDTLKKEMGEERDVGTQKRKRQ